MNHKQIELVLAVYEEMNVTRAARRCRVSQPTLAQAVERIEAYFGGALFTPGGRGVELTELGRMLRAPLESLEKTHRSAKQLADAVSDLDVVDLDIGIMRTVGPRRFAPLLEAFGVRHPDVRLVLHDVAAGAIVDGLGSGALEAVIQGRHGPLPGRLEVVPLFREAYVLAVGASSPLAGREAVDLEEMARYPYLDRLTCEFRPDLLMLLAERSLSLDIAMRSEREAWIVAAIEAGRGVAIMPEGSVTGDGIVGKPVSDLPVSRAVELATVTGRAKSRALGAFTAFCREHFAAEPAR